MFIPFSKCVHSLSVDHSNQSFNQFSNFIRRVGDGRIVSWLKIDAKLFLFVQKWFLVNNVRFVFCLSLNLCLVCYNECEFWSSDLFSGKINTNHAGCYWNRRIYRGNSRGLQLANDFYIRFSNATISTDYHLLGRGNYCCSIYFNISNILSMERGRCGFAQTCFLYLFRQFNKHDKALRVVTVNTYFCSVSLAKNHSLF